jgi:hypothetical protein
MAAAAKAVRSHLHLENDWQPSFLPDCYFSLIRIFEMTQGRPVNALKAEKRLSASCPVRPSGRVWALATSV